MKEAFKGYYRPTEPEFQALWKGALVSVDANVLLDLFRFSASTSDALFGILKSVEPRLWLSHEAAHEYHRNLPSVLERGAAECRDVLKALDELEKRLGPAEPQKKRTPPHVGAKELKKFAAAKKAITVEIERAEKALLDQLADHPLKESIAVLFTGHVGAPLTPTEFESLSKEGKERYARRQPPGFSDLAKPEPARYGDLIVWRELLNHCKSNKSDLLFVTNDQKEDWFQIVGGRRLGPRPELIDEFHRETGRRFYLYSVANFMELANKFLKAGVPKDAIDEANAAPVAGTVSTVSDEARSPRADTLLSSTVVSTDPIASAGGSVPFHSAGELLASVTSLSESPLVKLQKQMEEIYRPNDGIWKLQKDIAASMRPFETLTKQISESLRPYETVTKQISESLRPYGAFSKQISESLRPLEGLASMTKDFTTRYGTQMSALQERVASIEAPPARSRPEVTNYAAGKGKPLGDEVTDASAKRAPTSATGKKRPKGGARS